MHDGVARAFTHGDVEEVLPGFRAARDVLGIDHYSRRAPVFGNRVNLAVHGRRTGEHGILRAGVVVGQTGQVEFLTQAQLDVGGNGVVGGHEYVPAGTAGLQLGQHLLVRAEGVDLNVHAGGIGEIFDIDRIVVVGPGGEHQTVAQFAIGIRLTRREPGNGGAEDRHGRAETGHTDEMAARHRAIPITLEFLHELLGSDRQIVFVVLAHRCFLRVVVIRCLLRR